MRAHVPGAAFRAALCTRDVCACNACPPCTPRGLQSLQMCRRAAACTRARGAAVPAEPCIRSMHTFNAHARSAGTRSAHLCNAHTCNRAAAGVAVRAAGLRAGRAGGMEGGSRCGAGGAAALGRPLAAEMGQCGRWGGTPPPLPPRTAAHAPRARFEGTRGAALRAARPWGGGEVV